MNLNGTAVAEMTTGQGTEAYAPVSGLLADAEVRSLPAVPLDMEA